MADPDSLKRPSSPSPPTCCECGVIVGSAGPSRACLLLPCQHVLHARCVEFLQRRWTLSHRRHLLALMATSSPSSPAFLRARLDCPGCRQFVQRAIPLFLGDSVEDGEEAKAEEPAASSPATGGGAVDRQLEKTLMDDVLLAQKMCLEHTEALRKEQQVFEDFTQRCSALHVRKLELARELSQCIGLLPRVSDEDNGRKVKAISEKAIHDYREEELQMFVSHATPALHRLQQELREVESQGRRKRRRYEHVKQKYLKLRGSAAPAGTSVEVPLKPCPLSHGEARREVGAEDLDKETEGNDCCNDLLSAADLSTVVLKGCMHAAETHSLEGNSDSDSPEQPCPASRRSRPREVLDVDAVEWDGTVVNIDGDDAVTVVEDVEIQDDEDVSFFSSSDAVAVDSRGNEEDDGEEAGGVADEAVRMMLTTAGGGQPLAKPLPRLQMRHLESLPRREGWQTTLTPSSPR